MARGRSRPTSQPPRPRRRSRRPGLQPAGRGWGRWALGLLATALLLTALGWLLGLGVLFLALAGLAVWLMRRGLLGALLQRSRILLAMTALVLATQTFLAVRSLPLPFPPQLLPEGAGGLSSRYLGGEGASLRAALLALLGLVLLWPRILMVSGRWTGGGLRAALRAQSAWRLRRSTRRPVQEAVPSRASLPALPSEEGALRPRALLPAAIAIEERREAREEPEATPITRVITSQAVVEELPSTPSAPAEPLPRPDLRAKWELPSLEVVERGSPMEVGPQDLQARAQRLEEALQSYGVDARVVQINPGPVVTQYGVEPGWDVRYREVRERDPDGRLRVDREGRPVVRKEVVSRTRVKVERITALANDLALALAAPTIRIEAPVPGKSVVGVEVPNATASVVTVRDVVESAAFQRLRGRSPLALALGKGVAGESLAADLDRMPHLLIAGATGSGKSVCINSIIACLLLHTTPMEVRLLLIDPKRVELTAFNPIPHLVAAVIVEADRAVAALRWAAREMDRRYRRLAAAGVRNVEAYQHSVRAIEPMPRIVIIIDELADLMMVAAEEVERTLCRLAQLARSTGIHLVVATQRPSVDVVTGLIKANFPTRISFAVTSQVDSRTILDTVGAEKLLGRGDMLYLPTDAARPKRLQGCFVSDGEIERLVAYWSDPCWQRLPPPQVTGEIDHLMGQEVWGSAEEEPLLERARELAMEHSSISISLLQRRLHIGYPRAARILEILEEEETIEPAERGRSRRVRSERLEDREEPLLLP